MGSIQFVDDAPENQTLVGEHRGKTIVVFGVLPGQEHVMPAWEAACGLADLTPYADIDGLHVSIPDARVTPTTVRMGLGD